MILDKIDELLHEVNNLSAKNAEEVERLCLRYLSKEDEVNALMVDFHNMAADKKKAVGMEINELKQTALDEINVLKEEVQTTADASDDIDLTHIPYPTRLGTRYPLTIVKNQICDIFWRTGFVLVDGPEIDDDLYVFTKLNFASNHPVRDAQDTLFVSKHPNDMTRSILLHSHTSSDQSYYMETHQPPIRITCPGRAYRDEAISARAHRSSHQVEGLYIDKNASFTDLKQVLLTSVREILGPDANIRLRFSYFPFTEPSVEMDISCFICGGGDYAFCKHTGWVETLGCGMIDPNILESCGIDSKVYSGYAFGMGVEHITNLKYRVSDLRMFLGNGLRFLKKPKAAY